MLGIPPAGGTVPTAMCRFKEFDAWNLVFSLCLFCDACSCLCLVCTSHDDTVHLPERDKTVFNSFHSATSGTEA